MEFAYFASLSCLDSVESPQQTIEDAWSQIQLADESGFSTIWFPEHHFVRQFTSPAPLLTAVDAAHRVKNARVGAGVIITAFRNPLSTAAEIALADQLTEGRLEVGFGRGSNFYEFERFKISHSESAKRNREFLSVVTALLRDENVAYDGEYWSFEPTTTIPRPRQTPTPPLWVAGRSPETLRFTVENGLGLMMTVQQEPIERLQAQINLVRAFVDDLGAPDMPSLSVSRIVYVTHDRRDALETLEWVEKLRSTSFALHHKAQEGETVVDGGYVEPSIMPDRDLYAPEELVKRLIVGDPETCVERLKEIEVMGVDQFVVFNDFGQPQDKVMRSLELFASDVAPHFASRPAQHVGAGS